MRECCKGGCDRKIKWGDRDDGHLKALWCKDGGWVTRCNNVGDGYGTGLHVRSPHLMAPIKIEAEKESGASCTSIVNQRSFQVVCVWEVGQHGSLCASSMDICLLAGPKGRSVERVVLNWRPSMASRPPCCPAVCIFRLYKWHPAQSWPCPCRHGWCCAKHTALRLPSVHRTASWYMKKRAGPSTEPTRGDLLK